jgi:meiotically up-regulated gene 157 (Mug157) protein
VYPQPARDVEGAVFRVSHGHHHSIWVNTAFDLEHGHIQYVYMIPEMVVTVIDLNLSKPSAESTHVRVAYERTALNTDVNEHVREFGEADRKNGKVWGEDIERYLVGQRSR